MRGLPLPFLAVFAAGLSAMIGGSAVVATRLAVPESNALAVTFLRFLGASTVILAFTLPRMNIRVEMRDMMCSVMLPVGALALLVAIIAGITAANWSALLAGWRRTG